MTPHPPSDRPGDQDGRGGRDRPIIFSAPMVRALLAGRKTQTRRILSAGTATVNGYPYQASNPAWVGLRLHEATARAKSPWTGHPDPHLDVPWEHPEDAARGLNSETVYRVRPRIEVGQRLWVKEGFARVGDNFDDIHACPDLRVRAYYRADDVCPEHSRWRSPIFMPRWASRLTLIVEAVKVERLQDISEEDAEAEGCDFDVWDQALAVRDYSSPDGWFCGWDTMEGEPGYVPEERIWRESYRTLWNSIHGKDAWDANPWVAALTFRAIPRNIDSLRPTPTGEDGAVPHLTDGGRR